MIDAFSFQLLAEKCCLVHLVQFLISGLIEALSVDAFCCCCFAFSVYSGNINLGFVSHWSNQVGRNMLGFWQSPCWPLPMIPRQDYRPVYLEYYDWRQALDSLNNRDPVLGPEDVMATSPRAV